MEAAKKKGDKDAEARYSFPKLYAEGLELKGKAPWHNPAFVNVRLKLTSCRPYQY